jgi:predicted Zn finger-like uncharacterized protein
MYAQCPECLTFFRVRPEQLKAAQGHVRCSQCKHVFNALDTLRGDLSADELRAVQEARQATDTAAEAPLLKDDSNGDLFAQLDYTTNEELQLGNRDNEADSPALHQATGHTVPADKDAAHDIFPTPRKQRSAWHIALYVLINILLVTVLAAQWVHFQRTELVQHPVIGPQLQQVYARLDRDIELPRNLDVIRVNRSNVASHPDHTRALLLTAVIENRADMAQPWPHLRIDLQDRWGDTVGARYFTPAEYLAEPDNAAEILVPNEQFAIELAIQDPGPDAVGFQVEPCFRNGTRYVCSSDFNRSTASRAR